MNPSMVEAAWHSYLHIVPAINFVALVLVLIVLTWIGRQTLLNRSRIMELELESRQSTEKGLAAILNKIDSLHSHFPAEEPGQDESPEESPGDK